MPAIRNRAATDDAHRSMVKADIGDIAGFLAEVFGRKLVAYMTGQRDSKTVGRWVDRERVPREEAEKKLRAAYQVFRLLNTQESAHTVRAWFIGMNPQLDDATPASAIREGRLKDVMVAAKSYTAGG